MDLGYVATDACAARQALLQRVASLVPRIEAEAAARDEAAAFPAAEFGWLDQAGALRAPFPPALGGLGIGTEPASHEAAFTLLRTLGRASLPLARVYEGHLNAIRLICRHAAPAICQRAAADAAAGHVFGVWNTDPGTGGVELADGVLRGAKILASGAGSVTRALITTGGAARRMLLVRLAPGARADLRGWTAQGMRASATGRVDFDGILPDAYDLIGAPGAYLQQPAFSGGAWRVAAVQLGGLDAIMAQFTAMLRARARAEDPHQLARIGTALIAQESAALFVARAAALAEAADPDPDQVVAYVGLARMAVEAACLDAIQLAQRSVGLAAFMRPAPIERIARDLATYLRQPMPDATLTEAAAYFVRCGLK